MKKILLFVVCMFTVSFMAVKAQDLSAVIAGTYTGDLNVTMNVIGDDGVTPTPLPTTSNVPVIVSDLGNNKISLALNNFTFYLNGSPIVLGDISVPETSLTGTTGNIAIRSVTTHLQHNELGYLDIDIDGTCKERVLELYIYVTGGNLENMGMESVEATYKSTSSPTGINNKAMDKIRILSINQNLITVTGVEGNSNFAIYNVTGYLVKSGALNMNSISVTDLSKGIYLINVSNQTIKFVKK